MFNADPTTSEHWLANVSINCPVLIAGPTASGKSGLALALAKRQSRVIVNADALQVYDCWRVLSARPSVADEAEVPHLLYGHVGAQEEYSVGHWLRDVAQILETYKNPIFVGGTGLYFTALTQGLAEIPATPAKVRALADARIKAEGHKALLAELDAETAARVDPLNPVRVQRAWEVLTSTGKGLAAWQAETGPSLLPLEKAEAVVLRPDVPWLDRRIAARFEQMMTEGALEEARAQLPDWQPTRPSARAIGAPELIAHLKGEMTLAEAEAAATLATRQYAKRQRTWMRNRLGHWPTLSLP